MKNLFIGHRHHAVRNASAPWLWWIRVSFSAGHSEYLFFEMMPVNHLPAGNRHVVTSDILGEAFEPEQRYENSDGSDLVLDMDMRGRKRPENPAAGPLEPENGGPEEIRL